MIWSSVVPSLLSLRRPFRSLKFREGLAHVYHTKIIWWRQTLEFLLANTESQSISKWQKEQNLQNTLSTIPSGWRFILRVQCPVRNPVLAIWNCLANLGPLNPPSSSLECRSSFAFFHNHDCFASTSYLSCVELIPQATENFRSNKNIRCCHCC